MSAPERPAEFAGLSLVRPLLMGVVNVTPDSFSDGGDHLDPDRAVAHGRRLLEQGADILDIGAESTRPGAAPVPAEEQLRRILPVLAGLAGAVLSVDTRSAAVMRAAIAAGARIINDVSALDDDPAALAVVAASDAAVVLMHKRGAPADMQGRTAYADVAAEVRDYLAGRIEVCRRAGIPRHRIAVDPGLGFAKDVDGNLALLRAVPQFAALGCAVLVGASRKSFIGRLAGAADPGAREPGSLAAGLFALDRGAHILRVHDVAGMRQAATVWRALAPAPGL